MATIRIAHISDLHFVPQKNHAVWEAVRSFINEEVRPHLILVTGDVTDSANFKEFEYAKACLNTLQTQAGGDSLRFRIVAGNHDRFLYRGLNPPLSVGTLFRRRWPRDKSGRFDNTFQGGQQIVAGQQCDLILRSSTLVDWSVRIIGLDSSATPEWFAQGALESTSIDLACKDAAKATNEHLVIAMVHHHLLPIPAVGKKKKDAGGLDQGDRGHRDVECWRANGSTIA